MAQVFTEKNYDAEFVISTANGTRSVREIEYTAPEDGSVAGTVMGQLTATDVYVPLDLGGADGSETVAGILLNGADEGTAANVGFVNDGEVSQARLTYPDGATALQIITINTALEALGIVTFATAPSVT